jgi:hypothetical protein
MYCYNKAFFRPRHSCEVVWFYKDEHSSMHGSLVKAVRGAWKLLTCAAHRAKCEACTGRLVPSIPYEGFALLQCPEHMMALAVVPL